MLASDQPNVLNQARNSKQFVLPIILTISLAHLINDLVQSVLPAIYPMLKQNYALSFFTISLLTTVYQLFASILQPIIGIYGDKQLRSYLLPLSLVSSLAGLIFLTYAPNTAFLFLAACLLGLGSSLFHPEGARVTRVAGLEKPSIAQSLFQVGGNVGSALGPLAAAYFITPYGQRHIVLMGGFALIGIILLSYISQWNVKNHKKTKAQKRTFATHHLTRKQLRLTLTMLGVNLLSKYTYNALFLTFYTFYLTDRFNTSLKTSQILLFAFLASIGVGTLLGGYLTHRYDHRTLIKFSGLAALPLVPFLPFASYSITIILTILIGLITSLSLASILILAQSLTPNHIGTMAGFFYGFAFGVSGIAATALGLLMDFTSVQFTFKVATILPFLSIILIWLPTPKTKSHKAA